jgi:hypothetical protein
VKAVRDALREYLSALRGGAPFSTPLRARVLDVLESSWRAAPGDDFIAGQRVAFLVKDGNVEAAREAAAACSASRWWCAALSGFTLQLGDDHLAADAAFQIALREAPPEVRTRWSSLASLLDGDAKASYDTLDAKGRGALEARLWWLADPLYARPGNDRKNEHYTRWVGLSLFEQALSAVSVGCSGGFERYFIQRGWPKHNDSCSLWWGVAYPTPPMTWGSGPSMLPTAQAILNPGAARPEDWRFARTKSVDSYVARYAQLIDLEEQTATFRRGDSVLIVAVTDLSEKLRAPDVRGGLVIARGERDEPQLVDGVSVGSRRIFQATVGPSPSLVASVELVGDEVAARSRFGASGPGAASSGPAISDLLLFDFGDASSGLGSSDQGVPDRLDAILPYAYGSSTVRAAEDVGIYVEAYGLPSEPLTISVSVSEPKSGRIRGWLESMRVVGRSERRTLEWTEVPEGDAWQRALKVTLSGLEAGSHVLEVSVRSGGATIAASSRPLEIVRADE